MFRGGAPAKKQRAGADKESARGLLARRRGRLAGGYMEISAIDRSAQPQTAPVATIPVDLAAENREVVRAIKALNGTEMFGEENQLMFRRDPETQRMVVRVVNRRTEEGVTQIPAEDVLRLAEDLKPKPAPQE